MVIKSFLIAFPKLRIISKFTESYIVLYPLKSLVVLSIFCFCSLVISSSFILLKYSIPSKIKLFIDGNSLSGDSKYFNG